MVFPWLNTTHIKYKIFYTIFFFYYKPGGFFVKINRYINSIGNYMKLFTGNFIMQRYSLTRIGRDGCFNCSALDTFFKNIIWLDAIHPWKLFRKIVEQNIM